MNTFYSKWLVIVSTTLLLCGCFDKESTTQLSFQPSYQGVALSCDTFFSKENKRWSYDQLQFYISDVSVKKQDGNWHSWLMSKTPYQTNNVGLLGEVCDASNKAENGSGNANWHLNFQSDVDLSQVSDIRFTLGIPFKFNHLNPLAQDSPLNDSSMFWVWQVGHKFLRLEIASKSENWLFHLGSTGCKAISVMRPPKESCLNPNRVTIELPINQRSTTKNRITFDLAKLLKGLQLKSENNCQSDPDNPACQQLFNNLGLVNNSSTQNSLSKDIFSNE
ncbi:MAG: metallo-mystery pair system four-Cys motif protein [Gammaproteobacteria bacterium]|nr:metallo-mystery pair system four-Cys motif protein [Gammaproteobacteria bacterium]